MLDSDLQASNVSHRKKNIEITKLIKHLQLQA